MIEGSGEQSGCLLRSVLAENATLNSGRVSSGEGDVPTAQGWVYHAAILGLCSKAVVCWAADTHKRTSLVLDALSMALTSRLIVRSERGEEGHRN